MPVSDEESNSRLLRQLPLYPLNFALRHQHFFLATPRRFFFAPQESALGLELFSVKCRVKMIVTVSSQKAILGSEITT